MIMSRHDVWELAMRHAVIPLQHAPFTFSPCSSLYQSIPLLPGAISFPAISSSMRNDRSVMRRVIDASIIDHL